MKEKRDPKARALSAFKYWIKRCQDAGITKTEMRKVVNQMVNRKTSQAVNQMVNQAVNREEKESGKETFPPTPPNREKGKVKEEDVSLSCAGARETSNVGSILQPVVNVHKPPTLEELLAWAKYNHYEEAFTRKWFNYMTNEMFWRHPKSGDPLGHWPAFFVSCWKQELKDRKQNTPKIGPAHHADNWLPTPKEDLEHVLG